MPERAVEQLVKLPCGGKRKRFHKRTPLPSLSPKTRGRCHVEVIS